MTSNDDPEKTGKPGEPAKRWHGKLPDRGFAVSFVLTMRQMAILALYAARLGEKISRSEIIRRMKESISYSGGMASMEFKRCHFAGNKETGTTARGTDLESKRGFTDTGRTVDAVKTGSERAAESAIDKIKTGERAEWFSCDHSIRVT